MENKEKLDLVPETVEEEFTDFDFTFARSEEESSKIHDEELKTKPTTFAKDALRRFAKNKASVVGAVIIGVLLTASFLSFLSPYDIEHPNGELKTLLPKIREADNGWWDGTAWRSRQPYNEMTHLPISEITEKDGEVIVTDVRENAICPGSLSVEEELEYFNQPNSYATGGYYRLLSDRTLEQNPNPLRTMNFTTSQYFVHVKPSDKVKLTITIGGTDDVESVTGDKPEDNRKNVLSAFDVVLNSRDMPSYDAAEYNAPITLATGLKSEDGEDKTYEIDVSGKLQEAGLSNAYFAEFTLTFPRLSGAYSYILVKEMKFTCDESASDHTKQRLGELSWDDANWIAKNTNKLTNPHRYWQSSALRLVYRSYCHLCSFRFDQYQDVLGLREETVGGSLIRKYIQNGWCEMDNPDDPTSFRVTNPDSTDCPVREILSVYKEGDVYQYQTMSLKYRLLGFDKMPMYILGTDSKGYDMLTLSLSCLKNSLFLAIITSAICLTIGLVWGSVSGYYGGAVDLTMERITDILSGVPWIVVMTLVMLLLGRTYLTFGIAVCLTGWIGTSSRTRTQFYRFKGREYVLASRTLGASDGRLIFRHILPNGLGTIVTGAVLMIPSTIFSEATLSYLGLGLQGTASFGVVLSENQIFLNSRPALIVWPSIIISLLMISFNLFGNGLRDALNPTLKGGEQ